MDNTRLVIFFIAISSLAWLPAANATEVKIKQSAEIRQAIMADDSKNFSRIAKKVKIDLNELDSEDDLTPLMSAAQQGSVKVLKEIIRLGGGLEKVNSLGDTALVVAIQNEQNEAAKALLAANANINVTSGEDKKTVLMLAVESTPGLIKAIIAKDKSALNAQNAKGETALFFAASIGQADGVKSLLSLGADASIKNKNGETALQIAQKRKYAETIKLLSAK